MYIIRRTILLILKFSRFTIFSGKTLEHLKIIRGGDYEIPTSEDISDTSDEVSTSPEREQIPIREKDPSPQPSCSSWGVENSDRILKIKIKNGEVEKGNPKETTENKKGKEKMITKDKKKNTKKSSDPKYVPVVDENGDRKFKIRLLREQTSEAEVDALVEEYKVTGSIELRNDVKHSTRYWAAVKIYKKQIRPIVQRDLAILLDLAENSIFRLKDLSQMETRYNFYSPDEFSNNQYSQAICRYGVRSDFNKEKKAKK